VRKCAEAALRRAGVKCQERSTVDRPEPPATVRELPLRMSFFRGKPVVANLAIAVAYALIGHATLALGETGGVELRRVIWASSGIAVTVGLLSRVRVWPGVAIGGAAATFLAGSGWIVIVGTAIGNAMEVALTVHLLRRFRFDAAMDRVSDILSLVFMSSGFAALVGAGISVTSLWLAGSAPAGGFLRLLLLWWLTHAMGILVLTPVGLTLVRSRAGLVRRHPAEIVGVLSAVAVTAWIPFFAPDNGIVSRLFFLPFPFLLWAAMRLGISGAAIGGLIATSFAMVAAVRHSGPLAVGTPNQTLILTWLFSNVVMIATLISTALVAGMERARAAHQSGEARLRAVLDGATEGIVVTNGFGVVTHVNRSVGEIWPPNVPVPALDSNIEAPLKALAASLPTAESRALLLPEPQPPARSGSVAFNDGRVWEVNIDRLQDADERHGSIWSFRDVTARIRDEAERQHLQAQLLHGQKLESLGVMAGGIAHDFNNLLMAIRGRAELITYTEDLSEEVKEDADAILRTSDQAAGLCRQMLTYAGRGAIEVRTIDLSDAIREIQDLLRVSVSRQVSLRLELGDEDLWVSADVTQLRQVALNLVSNASDAVEATKRGGTVSVKTRRGALTREWLSRAVVGPDVAEGEFCILEVTDDGAGMSEDTVRQIFDPFFSSKGTGRGLGLSSTLGVIRRHKGVIAVESQPGEGSRFVVAFPCASPPVAPGKTAIAPGALDEFEGRTILVVDDDDEVRNAVRRMLHIFGIKVREARNGDEALAQLTKQMGRDIDLVLLDLTMPVRSGRATLAAMREMGIGTPVIIASGYSAEAIEDESVAAFIQKPFRLEHLRSAIGEVLGASAARA
jgi:signal transduction histidine kinase/integral membrane sensor domain MASE1/CheY-like chemotaxis protein